MTHSHKEESEQAINSLIERANLCAAHNDFAGLFQYAKTLIANHSAELGERRIKVIAKTLHEIVGARLYSATSSGVSVTNPKLALDISLFICDNLKDALGETFMNDVFGVLDGIAIGLMKLDVYNEALLIYEKLFECQPTPTRAWTLSYVYLHLGLYGNAWRGDVHRRSIAKSNAEGDNLWDGSPCDKLLVRCGYGVGDLILFMRFLPIAAQRVGTIHLSVPERLAPLAKRYEGIGNVIVGADVPSASFDAWVDEFMLPRALGLGEADVTPLPRHFLFADHEIEPWRRVIRRSDSLHIGIIWSANGKVDPRSVGLETLSKLFAHRDVTFVCLQGNKDKADIFDHKLPANFIDFGLYDINNTALAMLSMDLVITPCCGMAQLSCALGVKTLAMVRLNCAWPWRSENHLSRWHASALIFRQSVEGRWDDVVDAVDAHIQSLK